MSQLNRLIIFISTFLLLYSFEFVVGSVSKVRLNNEKLLIKKLTENYPQKIGRPFLNDSTEPLIIKLKVQLIQIVKLDATDQVLVTNVWNSFHWSDPFLSWDPANYNGLETIRIPASFAFEHDVHLLNSADERLEYKREHLLVIYSQGDLLWVPRSVLTSTCLIDLKLFPFDKQNCTVSFGSWSYDRTLVDLEFYEGEDKIDLNDYESSKEWKIARESMFGQKHYRLFENKNYTVLTYYLIVHRNPGFYTYLLIFPCVLLAFLTMTVFWLPPENPSKIILGMNIFSGFFLLLLLLADLVPTSTNEVPYIGIYFCLNMIMIALSSFLCTVVVHLYFRADTFCKMPAILKKIFLEWLARLYCMQPAKSAQGVTQRTLLSSGLHHGGKNVINADKFEKFELLKERFKNYRENVLKIGFENLLKTHPTVTASCNNINMSNFNLYSSTAASSPTSTLNLNKQCLSGGSGGQPNCPCSFCTYCAQQQTILTEIAYLNNLEHDIKEIRDYLRDTRKKLETKEMKVKLACDWKQIALVLDRTFFFIYLMITIVTLIILFPREHLITKAPNRAKMAAEAVAASAAASVTPSSILSSLTDAVSSVTSATLAFDNHANEQNSNGFLFF